MNFFLSFVDKSFILSRLVFIGESVLKHRTEYKSTHDICFA